MSVIATEQSHCNSNRFIQLLALAQSTDPQQISTFWLGSLLGLRDIHGGYVACVYMIMAFNKVVCFCIYQTKKLRALVEIGEQAAKTSACWPGQLQAGVCVGRQCSSSNF